MKTIINENAVNIINELLLLVGRMKKDLKTSRWIHNMPKGSDEYICYIYCAKCKLRGLHRMFRGLSENDYKIAITHLKKGPCHLQF